MGVSPTMTSLRTTQYRPCGCNSCNQRGNLVLYWDNWIWAAWLSVTEKMRVRDRQTLWGSVGQSRCDLICLILYGYDFICLAVWRSQEEFQHGTHKVRQCVSRKKSTSKTNASTRKPLHPKMGRKERRDQNAFKTPQLVDTGLLVYYVRAKPLHQWECVWGAAHVTSPPCTWTCFGKMERNLLCLLLCRCLR